MVPDADNHNFLTHVYHRCESGKDPSRCPARLRASGTGRLVNYCIVSSETPCPNQRPFQGQVTLRILDRPTLKILVRVAINRRKKHVDRLAKVRHDTFQFCPRQVGYCQFQTEFDDTPTYYCNFAARRKYREANVFLTPCKYIVNEMI